MDVAVALCCGKGMQWEREGIGMKGLHGTWKMLYRWYLLFSLFLKITSTLLLVVLNNAIFKMWIMELFFFLSSWILYFFKLKLTFWYVHGIGFMLPRVVDVNFSHIVFTGFRWDFVGIVVVLWSEAQGSLYPALPVIPTPEGSQGNNMLKEQ